MDKDEVIRKMLEEDEDYRQFLYLDSAGVPTFGYGRNARDNGVTHAEALYLRDRDLAKADAAGQKFFTSQFYHQFLYYDVARVPRIGYGRNLRDDGVDEEEALYLLNCDIAKAEQDCQNFFHYWFSLPDAAQEVLVMLRFNMGLHRLLGFHDMLRYIEAGEWEEAANELRNSLWWHEVGHARRERLVGMLRGIV